jgi:hypothetical protein
MSFTRASLRHNWEIAVLRFCNQTKRLRCVLHQTGKVEPAFVLLTTSEVFASRRLAGIKRHPFASGDILTSYINERT